MPFRAVLAAVIVSAIAASAPAETTLFRGRALTYEVVDGLAVHAGDIILGTAEEVERPPSTRPPGKGGYGPTPRFAARHQEEDHRWPDARVPYVIDEEFPAEAAAKIRTAIDEWNSKTVMTLTPRAEEEDYVRFTTGPGCSSQVGRVGGEQVIRLRRHDGCSVHAAIHEIGHTVGLYHEHQRQDRDQRLMIRSAALADSSQYRSAHPGSGSYDYGSVMHYSDRHMESIPPGMPIGATGHLSPGDIDGVARMYGQPPTATTIATNPPGLEIAIDGIRTATPVTVQWERGSVHILEAPAGPQVSDGTRHLFARWNDGHPRHRTVTADPAARTWYEANFIVQRRIAPLTSPSAAGTVTVAPAALGGWHTIRSKVTWSAAPASGTEFQWLRWNDGLATNPRVQTVPDTLGGPAWSALGYFTLADVFRIEPTAGPIRVRIGDYSFLAPTAVPAAALAAYAHDGTVTVSVDEVQYSRETAGTRFRFEGWSDDAPAVRTVNPVPAPATTLIPRVALEHLLNAEVAGAGEIDLDPASEHGWYADGTVVRATARPAGGWEFVGWGGDPPPAETRTATTAITMAAPRRLSAAFSRTPSLPPTGAAATLPSFGETGGYRVDPPADALELAITASAPASAPNLDLYVKAIRPGSAEGIWFRAFWYRGWTSWDPAGDADHRSESPGNSEAVVISAASTPPLDPTASYYVTLVTDGFPRPEIQADLQLQVTRRTAPAPPAGLANPRALTFVGPAASPAPTAQTVTLTNDGGSDMRFSVTAAGTAWMLATPASGTIPAGTTAEIQIRLLPLGLPADTHNGTVTIARSGTDGTSIEPLEIPVAFAAY